MRFGDFNVYGLADRSGFGRKRGPLAILACATGPGVSVPANCVSFKFHKEASGDLQDVDLEDFDVDGHVDIEDFAASQLGIGTPQ